jgi:hypothetical protein
VADIRSLSPKEVRDLNVALNEASLVAVDVEPAKARAVVKLEVLTLPEQGPMPDDRGRQLILNGVGRVAASHRDGRADDPHAPVLPLERDGLTAAIATFLDHAIYGWEFINRGDDPFVEWSNRLSMDSQLPGRGTQTLDLFQEDGRRVLDLRIWFEELTVATASGAWVEFDEFTAGGVRWWDALYARDPRVSGHGIVTAGPWPDQKGNQVRS